MEPRRVDVIILGAGASGMMCAMEAGRRDRTVLVLDHVGNAGRKILISGGGRCNFTNRDVRPGHYVSDNPHFCKSALSRFTPNDIIVRLETAALAFEEREFGRLFCTGSARNLVELLRADCRRAGVEFVLGDRIVGVEARDGGFRVKTMAVDATASSLVVATGGLSYPRLGATGFGHELARQFGLRVVETAPALDGFIFTGGDLEFCRDLAGISLRCGVRAGGVSFEDDLLFTHAGLSGPAALQASLHWRSKESLRLDWLPRTDLFRLLMEKKAAGYRGMVKNALSEFLASRLSESLCVEGLSEGSNGAPFLHRVSDKTLRIFCDRLHAWELKPQGTVGYAKAEVTRGGVDTHELSSRTMEARKVPGLYFIGEVVDVTGWLGGYNLHWAWASGWCAGQVV